MPPQHQYPGINVGLKYAARQQYGDPESSYEVCGGYDDRLLPVREIFMMTLMDRLTDKPDWHKKVMDEAIVAKWRKEALEQSERELFDEITTRARKPVVNGQIENSPPYEFDREWDRTRFPDIPFPQRHRIVSEAAFDFCIEELRAKAAHFERTGLVPTFDAIGRAIAKSDTLVDGDLKQRLRDAFERLRADQKATDTVDWHPRTDEMVQDLVHPSLYPFVYGRSPFIQDEVVGVADAITDWAGKGETAPSEPASSADLSFLEMLGYGENGAWSEKYQWLPANLIFQDDGSVKFSSYVNNLHPTKHRQAYAALEKLIDLAIPAWDQVLGGCGRGKEAYRFSMQREAHDDETDGLWEPLDKLVLAESSLQPTRLDLREMKGRYDWNDPEPGPADEGPKPEYIEKWRWEHIRDAILPEPDGNAEVDYVCTESIAQKFKDSGLQVIVKMARIELTPEKPDFPVGGWHVEGMNNERICATALYYLDSENITPSSLAFRMSTERDQEDLQYTAGQDAFHWLERVYGVNFREDPNLQYYGSIQTCEGRLLAFPNVFQHRVTPFSLKDPSKPGHRSFIALWLVDPTCRIVSTANVPPQQLDWWSEAVFGGSGKAANTGDMPVELLQLLLEKKGLAEKLSDGGARAAAQNARLPNELVDMLRKEGGDPLNGLMSLDEAKEYRLELMAERTVAENETNEAQNVESYSFCEH